MPKHKDLKRIVRSRMEKTGESYTAARSHVVARKRAASPEEPAASGDPAAAPKPAPAAATQPEPDYAALAGMSDATIAEKTGCTWKQWVGHLDHVGAAALPHREIVAHVQARLGGSGWWAQSVAVGYERIHGLRAIGQRRDGSYEASKSSTFAVPVARLFEAFADEAQRQRWLPGVALVVKRATAHKTIRITWDDDTPVEVYFVPKGDDRSNVAVQHRKLPSKERAEELKRYWAERFDALQALLG